MPALPIYLSHSQDCDYLAGLEARLGYVDPHGKMTTGVYSELASRGFRRSGNWLYRPFCPSCTACIPVRIPVLHFHPNRAQQRTLKKNSALDITRCPPVFSAEHYALYRRYLEARHPGGSMANSSNAGDYLDFLTSAWSDTGFYSFRQEDRLVAVAVIDHLENALSSVYTFYDPNLANRSLGDFAVLWQIQHALELGLQWVYLGYWVKACRKMSYKNRYRPLEAYLNDSWKRFEKGEDIGL